MVIEKYCPLQAPEEDDESADLVPNLVTQKTGRFTHTTTRSMTAVAHDDAGLVGNLARSLPVSVPPPPGMERLSGMILSIQLFKRITKGKGSQLTSCHTLQITDLILPKLLTYYFRSNSVTVLAL